MVLLCTAAFRWCEPEFDCEGLLFEPPPYYCMVYCFRLVKLDDGCFSSYRVLWV